MVTNKGKHAQTLKKHGEILEKIEKKTLKTPNKLKKAKIYNNFNPKV